MLTTIRILIAALVLTVAAGAFGGGANWMASLDGNKRLSQFSIPGTHDSGAQYEPLSGTAKCQNTTIAQQLNFGVRFLDIRCRHVNDAFAIYHGTVDEQQTFRQVLDQVITFLNSNPGECVIMSVKEESTASGTTRSFEATFDTYVATNPGKWSLGSSVPILNTVRGQIVLLRRFGATVLPKGLDASYWPDNTSFVANNLAVQDCYQVSDNATKWTYVTNEFSAAFGDSNANVLHLNFTSGYKPGLFGIPNVPTVSNYINPLLQNYFTSALRGHYGCVIMDFADANRSELIYSMNFSVSGPVVNFDASPLSGAVPLTVSFTNQSTGATNFSWAFGDGHASSSTHPVNIYTLAGSYSVRLTAIGNGVTNSLTCTNFVLATNLSLLVVTPPSLDFCTTFIGSAAEASITVSNAGAGVLTGNATIIGGPFTIGGAKSAPLFLPGFNSTNLEVQFIPLTAGSSVMRFPLSPTAVAPRLASLVSALTCQ
jgi:PKD repeat protein